MTKSLDLEIEMRAYHSKGKYQADGHKRMSGIKSRVHV
jgi:hypothetical protein